MSTETERTHRPVRSYVLREGRMTGAQRRALERLWGRYGVDLDPGSPLDPAVLFENGRPAWLEIGFGNGDALAEMAETHPERSYLGIEVHRPGVGRLLLTLEEREIPNVRVIRADAGEVLDRLRPGSLDGVLLFFPDPWPKKKHHKRRIFQPRFVAQVARVLAPGGILHVATDWSDYAEHMREVMDGTSVFEPVPLAGDPGRRPFGRPPTRFEQRGLRLEHPVHDLVFRRV